MRGVNGKQPRGIDAFLVRRLTELTQQLTAHLDKQIMRNQPSNLSDICRALGLNNLPPLEAGPEAMASGPRALAETDLCWLTPSSASQPTSSAETAVPGAGLRSPRSKPHLAVLEGLRARFPGLKRTQVPAWQMNLDVSALTAKRLSAWGMFKYFHPHAARAFLRDKGRPKLGYRVPLPQYKRDLREAINLGLAFQEEAKPIPRPTQLEAAATLSTEKLAIFLGITISRAEKLRKHVRGR